MSEHWGPHDLGGQEGGPIDLSEHDVAHWEWQIDAMVRLALREEITVRGGIQQGDVRFGWHQEAEPNLSNKEGLPASPFRTDK